MFRELDDGRVLVQVDINRSKAEDVGMVAGVYRALLWAAATGRVDGIIGSPPTRVDLVQKMMWLMVVAKAARMYYGGHPLFAMIEGKKLMDLVHVGTVDKWQPVAKTWDAFTEVMCLEEVGNNVATNLALGSEVPLATTTASSSWTSEFKGAIVDAVRSWGREPEALQVMKWVKKLDANPERFLEAFTDKELAMWRTHVKNNHLPFNRRCKTCATSTGTGRIHRKVRHPSLYCLSLDIAGPCNKASDPNHKDYRYLLVGAYTMPKLPQANGPSDPHEPQADGPSDPHEPQADGPSDPHEPQADGPSDPHEPQADGPSDPHEPQADGPSDPHEPQADGPSDPHEPQADGPSDPLEPRLEVLPLDFEMDGFMFDPMELMAGSDGERNDGVPHPMEEMSEKRAPKASAGDEGIRGLSEEEFKRIFDEVGYELDFQTIYVVKPMRSRTAMEVTAAVQDTVLKLKAEGLSISRIHADRAREFRVQSIRRWALERGIFCTFTEGQAPQSNGRAEAAVKWIKSSVKRLLGATDLPKDTWAVAANYAAQDRMERLLRQSSSMLPFGTRVHVRSKVYGTGGKYDLDSRWKAGRYVGPSLDVRGGHLVRFESGAYMTSTHLRPHLVDPDKVIDLDEYEVMLPTPVRRLKGKTGLKEVEGEVTEGELVLPHDPDHPAEKYAMRLLEENGMLTPDQLENLAMMLPSTSPTPKRFGPQKDSQKIWNAGAFVHGGIVGVKTATTSFPASTKVFVKYVKQIKPDHKFNAVAVITDVETTQHVDAHNVGENLVAGLSSFKGGALEVEEPSGMRVLSLEGDVPYQVFEPRFRHSTRPWPGGSRIVLVAYSTRDSAKIKQPQVDLLHDLGFDWVPHYSKPTDEQGEPLALKVVRVGLMDATKGNVVPDQHRDSPEHEGAGGVDCEGVVPDQPRDSPEHEGAGGGIQLQDPLRRDGGVKESMSFLPHR